MKNIIGLLLLAVIISFTNSSYKAHEEKIRLSPEVNFSNTIDYTVAKNAHFKY